MHVYLPLDQPQSPPLQWVKTRVSYAKELVLEFYWDQESHTIAWLERQLNNAHTVIVLLHAQPSRLQKLVFRAENQNREPTPNGPVLRAIGRFTALTELYLCDLTLEERSLQELSGLPSLREFRGKWLFCVPKSDLVTCGNFAGPVAEALWAVALGWPWLLDFELTQCTFSRALGNGNLQTTANSPLRRLHIDEFGNAAPLVSGISALQDLQQLDISVRDSLGSIGRLRTLTALDAEFDEAAFELDLQNPELQLLNLRAFDVFDVRDQDVGMWRCLSALSSLKSLHLCNLRLADLPAEVVLLTKLTSLRIERGLDSMGRDLSPLENLVELHLSCKYFSSLPPMLSTCRSLEQLVLTESRMEISIEGVNALKCLPRLQQVIMERDHLGNRSVLKSSQEICAWLEHFHP